MCLDGESELTIKATDSQCAFQRLKELWPLEDIMYTTGIYHVGLTCFD